MVLPNAHFNSCGVVAIVRSKLGDETEDTISYVLGTYKIIKIDENEKPKVVLVETTQKGESKLYGFYKGFKIVPEPVENRPENKFPWVEVVDENEKLLEVHLTVNVRS